ncbi:MAG: nucleoside permease [Bacteroides sp.]|nr:nucleoside permease [Bacteroides sp.]
MKARLSLLYFLQFSVWGCYLTCFGQFLGAGGLGGDIAWFYAAIGLVSILTPSLLGRLADQTGRPELLLGTCHLAAAVVMFAMWQYGMTHPQLEFKIFYPLYLLFLSLYMPTMALANTSTFGLLTQAGHNTVTSFPTVRVWGTVGFVAAMWFVNSAYWHNGSLGFTLSDNMDTGRLRFQYNAMQLLCSGVMGLVTSIYAFSLPRVGAKISKAKSPAAKVSLAASLKAMFGKREIAVFLIFVIFSGVCLQISNGFATPFITHFSGIKEFTDSLASGNATMLFSLSQISEAACILLVGISLKWKGIRWVYAIGLLAWSLRFLMLGTGDPAAGLWLLIGSMLVYGLAFNFITIAGHLYIQQVAPAGMKGFAQGLMMFMSNGVGATFGTIAAGAIVNKWCQWQTVTLPGSDTPMRLFMGNWEVPWLIFAAYAFVVMLAWLVFFRQDSHSTSHIQG